MTSFKVVLTLACPSMQAYRSPGGPGIRLDGAMTAGNYVSRHYDSLLVKVPYMHYNLLTPPLRACMTGACMLAEHFAWQMSDLQVPHGLHSVLRRAACREARRLWLTTAQFVDQIKRWQVSVGHQCLLKNASDLHAMLRR